MRKGFSFWFLLFCWLGGGLLWADPFEAESPVTQYAGFIQEQSGRLARRLSQQPAGLWSEDSLLVEYQILAEKEMSRLLDAWEEAQFLSSSDKSADDPDIKMDMAGIKNEDEIRKEKEGYRRECEELTELFLQRYLLRREEGFSSLPAEQEPGSAGMEESVRDVDAVLQFALSRTSELDSLDSWKEAETSIAEQRLTWEKEAESQYRTGLEAIGSEYSALRSARSKWEERYSAQFTAMERDWQAYLKSSILSRQQMSVELELFLRDDSEKYSYDVTALSKALRTAGEMADYAEIQLFIEKDPEYWREVRAENFLLYSDGMQALEQSMPSVEASLNSTLDSLEQFRLTLSQEHLNTLEDLVQFAELPGEARPSVSQLKSELQTAKQDFLKIEAESGGSSPHTASAYQRYLAAKIKLLIAGEENMAMMQALHAQLEEARRDYARVVDTAAESDSEYPQSAGGGIFDGRRQALIKGLQRESELWSLYRNLQQAEKLAAAKREELAGRIDLSERKIEEKTQNLVGVDPGLLSQDEISEFIDGLESNWEAGKLQPLLKDFAWAYYYRHQDEADPGYSSANQVYQRLKSKLNFSEKESLGAYAEEKFNELKSSPEEAALFTLYETLLSASEAANSLLYRGMIEDTGALLFNRISDEASDKIDSLKTERNILLGQAAYYGGLAATAYATLNFVGGAILTSISGGFILAATEVNKDMDDLESLKTSIIEQKMSGSEERGEFSRRLSGIYEEEEMLRELQDAEDTYSVKVCSREEWIEAAGGGEGALAGLFSKELAGGVQEYLSFSQNESSSQEQLSLSELLVMLREQSAERLESIACDNQEILNEALNTIGAAQREMSLYGGVADRDTVLSAARLIDTAATSRSERNPEFLLDMKQLALNNKAVEWEYASLHIESYERKTYRQWMRQMESYYQENMVQWQDSLNDLRQSASQWDADFRSEYKATQSLWKRRGDLFSRQRRIWLQEAVSEEAGQLLREGSKTLGLSPGLVEQRLLLVEPAGLPRWNGAQLPTVEIETVQEEIDFLDLGISSGGAENQFLKELQRTQANYNGFKQRIDDVYSRVRESADRVAFESGVKELSELLHRHQEALRSAVMQGNSNVRNSLHTTLKGAGYRKNGTAFQRKSLVDVTLYNHERELQSIESYHDFRMPELDWDRQLQVLINRADRQAQLQRKYQDILEEINLHRQMIFGDYEGDGTLMSEKLASESRDLFISSRDGFSRTRGYQEHKDMKGMFNWHVGYAPVMAEEEIGKVRIKGAGEIGRMMEAFYLQEQRLSRGLSMLETASWDRRLWDDDKDNDGEADGLLHAFSVREAADVGLQVATSLLLSPGAGAMLANLGDDLLFGLADTAGGYSSLGESAFRFGKTAALQFALSANSHLWGSGAASAGWSEGLGSMEGLGSQLGRSAVRQGLHSTAAAFSFEDGAFQWSGDRFTESMFNRQSYFTLAADMSGALGRNALENTVFHVDNVYGFSGEDIAGMRDAASFGGRMLRAGAEYAFTGNAALNLAGIGGIGLLELDLQDGAAHFALGTGGYRANVSDIVNLADAAGDFYLQNRIGRYATATYAGENQQDLAAQILRFQASFGDIRAEQTLADILSGKVELLFTDDASYRGLSQSVLNGASTIQLSLHDMQSLDPASIALTLQHEAYRDGIVTADNLQETLNAVYGHSAMAGRISRDELYGIAAFKNDTQVLRDMLLMSLGGLEAGMVGSKYSSENDFWKLSSEGTLLWDGSHHLWTEGGRLLEVHESGSFSQDVADYLGIDRAAAQLLMSQAGLVYKPQLGTYVQTQAGGGIQISPELQARYDLYRHYERQQASGILLSQEEEYVWALREHHYKEQTGAYPSDGYAAMMEELLRSRESFGSGSGIYQGAPFPGITKRADLHHYSQLRLEEMVNGFSLDASAGDGYCLAESISLQYVDGIDGISWNELEAAFLEAEWGASFDPSSGYVGDKADFTSALSAALSVSAAAEEYRFSTLDELNSYLAQDARTGGGYDAYHVVADYGSHFTYVRPDGLELNTYPGWTAPEQGPESLRLYLWDYD